MKTQPTRDWVAPQQAQPAQQLQVRSDLRAGVEGDCSLGLQYWKNQYNSLKKIAQATGCA